MASCDWDFGELDGLFNGETKAPAKKPSVNTEKENWISPDEWYWRAADRMLDADRKSKGLKATTAYRREKDFQSHLQERSRTRERDARESQKNEGLDDNVDRRSVVPVVVRGATPSGF